MAQKKHAPTETNNTDEDLPTAEERIENALQAASETHSSWMHRCEAILTALGANFGDPEWEMPDVAKRKDMLISSLLYALDRPPQNDLAWPENPESYFAQHEHLPARGKIVPFYGEITLNSELGFKCYVPGDTDPTSYRPTLSDAIAELEGKYRVKVKAALMERLEDNGGMRRPHLAWDADSVARTPMGVFRIHRGEEPGTFQWELITHEGVQHSCEDFEGKRSARLAAEKHFSKLMAQCFALGDRPLFM